MKLIQNKRNGEYFYDAGVDMAMQDYIIHHLDVDDDLIFPYLSEPKVQIGRYQNTKKEIDLAFAKAHDIKISRRDTGGGALYIDEGSPAFCYIFKDTSMYADYAKLYEPVIEVLKELGVKDVKMAGRNDLEVDGYKISGAAMRKVKGKVHAGYSVLIDVDYDTLGQVLTPDNQKITSKGIDSIRKRVRGIREFLAPEYQDLTHQEIVDLITCRILGVDHLEEAPVYQLSKDDWAVIDQACEDKYQNWQWNYGQDPVYEQVKHRKFSGGLVEIHLNVDKGRIRHIKIYGDFFGSEDIKDVETLLTGQRLKEEDLAKALHSIQLNEYFGYVTADELVQLLVE
ncbi:lipoate--protein ligase [Dolosicoccus paucivorans]|uniref:lipoate--protein ligase n=1 Tax=Dolosicoccus paucivorans TaxID=84521 RepID=A0A2N6SNJ2_9LACT|nr:lipoate--protein ligase [Dolosicoccus paucivorans]PMB83733.1 lipoate--protein ligase [Dolosicoccus paucivorans]PMC58647.1 lipoate--protein ligase [Dolosicoccus paucivorans]